MGRLKREGGGGRRDAKNTVRGEEKNTSIKRGLKNVRGGLMGPTRRVIFHLENKNLTGGDYHVTGVEEDKM